MVFLVLARLRLSAWSVQKLMAAIYISGALMFVVGSVLFLPHLPTPSETIGVWLFIWGSVLFGLGSFIDGKEVVSRLRALSDTSTLLHTRYELANNLIYFVGSSLFLIGSIFFFPWYGEKFERPGVWLFIIGSIFFHLGAILNGVEIKRLHKQLQVKQDEMSQVASGVRLLVAKHTALFNVVLFNIGGAMFIVGSVLLFPWYSADYTDAIILYIVASILYFFGAVLSLFKIYADREIARLRGSPGCALGDGGDMELNCMIST